MDSQESKISLNIFKFFSWDTVKILGISLILSGAPLNITKHVQNNLLFKPTLFPVLRQYCFGDSTQL